MVSYFCCYYALTVWLTARFVYENSWVMEISFRQDIPGLSPTVWTDVVAWLHETSKGHTAEYIRYQLVNTHIFEEAS